MMENKLKNLLEQLYTDNYLDKKQIKIILDKISYQNSAYLFELAHKTRLERYQNKVYLRALLEFSNICKNNCYYCGIRKNNHKLSRYRFSPEEIYNYCKLAYNHGYRTFVLQSGEDSYYTVEILSDLIKKLKSKFSDTAVTLSIGEYSRKDYKKLYQAGADRFLLRHETISRKLYDKYHPGMNHNKRIQSLKDMKEIGYQIGAGFIVGLPGQTNKILAEELIFLKNLNPDMVGIGPLITHPQTPLANYKNGSIEKTLILLALIRLFLPNTLLPVTTALNTLDHKGWEKGLKAGANVIMPVVSPAEVRIKYEIYQNKGNTDISNLPSIKKRVEKSGFKLDMGRGDSLNWLK